MTKARKLLDKVTLITLYYKFIYPYMCYFNHVWGNTYVSYLEKLFLMQEKIKSFSVYDQEPTQSLYWKMQKYQMSIK